jgi:hypothetical protein
MISHDRDLREENRCDYRISSLGIGAGGSVSEIISFGFFQELWFFWSVNG